MKEPKKAVTGAACIMVRFFIFLPSHLKILIDFCLSSLYLQLALWLGFGLFGPCGIVTGLSTTGAAVLLLP